MANSLVIVESPAKAKTIKKYLGKNFSVMASLGHVIDLPERELGVDIENGFQPKYVVIRGKAKILKKITDAAGSADAVYLAPDPDREGEAIAWHLADKIRKSLKSKAPKIHRVRFNEITKSAITEAVDRPDELNACLFEAQQARRVLDRIVGYRISPLLWEKVKRGLSAGRVQSVAVRIVCDREAEIGVFKSKEYWSVVANLLGGNPPPFEAKLVKIDKKDFEIGDEKTAASVVGELKGQKFVLTSIKKSERNRRPSPPFITSKLQQEAARKLGFTAKKTMALAQMLYEGVEIGEEGAVGLITYMRTDSIRVSNQAIDAVRAYIADVYGKNMVPEEPVIYKSKKGAQDAHEAIRPTYMEYPPEKVKDYVEKDVYRLYDLIWKRFVASQMKPAVFDQTTFEIAAGRFDLRASGQVMRFPGFISVYMEGVDDVAEKDEEENPELPPLSEGETLELKALEPHQHFTQPPPRFTEATLVRELEEKGIGRPSTYASIMSTIQDKGYVKKIEKRFHPSELGKLVNGLLVANFPEILEIDFTAQMENELDEVEEGRRTWKQALDDFYGPFEKALAKAKKNMRDVKKEMVETDVVCEKCGSKMVIRWGRHGEFLACSAYPECRTTKEFTKKDDGAIVIKEIQESGEVCEKCGKPMLIRRGRFGKFLACSGYPECKSTRSIGTGIKCPECGKGQLVQKGTKTGRSFFGCDKYPDCKFATWDMPVSKQCPDCASPILVQKRSKKTGEMILACPKKGCSYKENVD